MGFSKSETSLPDVWIIQPDVFGDERGFLLELYNQTHFEQMGLGHLQFVQDNLSFSSRGTLRGLHFQHPPFAQGKLIRPLEGKVLDVIVDLRKESSTYGQSLAVELDAENHTMLYVPEGFAHGFQVLSATCLFFYKCTQVYHHPSEGGIAWNDADLNIRWADIPPTLSAKDKLHPSFSEFDSPF